MLINPDMKRILEFIAGAYGARNCYLDGRRVFLGRIRMFLSQPKRFIPVRLDELSKYILRYTRLGKRNVFSRTANRQMWDMVRTDF